MDADTKYCSIFNSDSSETVAYNTPLFPAYAAYGFLSTYPDYSCVSHWHKDLEFILVKKGAMTYNVNGRLIELKEGSGILVNSYQLHYGFSPEHNECEFVCILLSPELLQVNNWFYQNFIEPFTENSVYPYLYLNRSGWMASIMEKLDKIYNSFGKAPAKPLSYFELINDFFMIMETLYENLDIENQTQKPEPSDLASLRNMMTYIEEHYMERITLADIALSGACCKSKCSLLFKKYLRDTPITYTTKLRLKKSLSTLLGSNSNISTIAYEYGFNGASYYCETFKKYYGMPPLIYKKNRTEGNPALSHFTQTAGPDSQTDQSVRSHGHTTS